MSLRRMLVVLALCPALCRAATFTVNLASDDATTDGTLRKAILDANAASGTNTIQFAIGTGAATISIRSNLPVITTPISIDGTTQPGFAGLPLITIVGNGTRSGSDDVGLTLATSNSTLRALNIQNIRRNLGVGLLISNGVANTVAGCFLGTDNQGTNAGSRVRCEIGLVLVNSANNVIGGTNAADRNLLSGNGTLGALITGAGSSNNVVLGNYIGLDVSGAVALGNFFTGGITFSNAPNNTLGGTAPGARNIISGNGGSQVVLSGAGATGNRIVGNFVGTKADGSVLATNAVILHQPSFDYGITLNNAPGNVIGGTTVAERNLLSGNYHGVQIVGTNAVGNLVQGNYIGTSLDGTAAIGNYFGVYIGNGASGTTVGGTVPGARNLISGSLINGIYILDSSGNTIQGNFLGTDYLGTTALGNTRPGTIGDAVGIYSLFLEATNNLIGGTNAAQRNVIAGNYDSGVRLDGAGTSNNLVRGNYIGVAADGVLGMANRRGVLTVYAKSNLVGGTNSGEGNIIAYSALEGVRLDGFGGTGNFVAGNTIYSNSGNGVTLNVANEIFLNSIYGNGGLGIDRLGDGPTANVPNGPANFPVLTSAQQGSTIVDGTLNGVPGCSYRIVFSTDAPTTAVPQGQFPLGFTDVTLDGAGNATFHVLFPPTAGVGEKITATATARPPCESETSETSLSVTVDVSQTAASTATASHGNHFLAGIVGEPVDTFTGELFDPLPPDLALAGPLPLVFARYYAAFLKPDGKISGALGDNWLHNFEMKLTTTATNVEVVNALGRVITFTNGGAGFTLTGRQDVQFQLATNGGNYFLGDPRSQRLFTFDSGGKLTKIEDGHGNTHTLAYTGNLLTTVSDGLGRALTFQYNASGQLTNVSDGSRSAAFTQSGNNLATARSPLGFVTSYSYDLGNINAGLLTAATMPVGNAPFTQTFDAQGRIATQTAAGSNLWSLNFSGATTTVTNPAGNIVQDVHTATGELSSYKDESGQTLPLASNSRQQRSLVTDRLGNATGIGYHAPSGKPSSLTNADGTVTLFSYAPRTTNGVTFYDLSQMVFPDGTSEIFSYDAGGNLKTRTDRAGKVFGFSYNARGQMLTATNPLGGVVTFTYNADGMPATRQDTDTGLTQFQFDSLKRLTNVVHPDATKLSASYDANDRLTSVTDERGNTTQFAYDANGRVTQITDANGKTVQFTYDSADRLVCAIDRLGQAAGVAYDQFDHVASATNRNGFVTRFAYDARQRLTAITDAGNQNWRFDYDNEGLLSAAANPLSQTNRIRRDQLGYETGVTNALNQSASLVRDSLRRVTQTIDGILRTNRYGYDARGLLTNATKPLIGGASYERNALGELSKITGLNGEQWHFGYTPMGRLASLADPLNRTRTYAYDTRGRLQKAMFADGTTRTNSYDAANNPTRLQFSAGPDLPFTYDALNRLTSTTNLTLAYDAEGRVTNSQAAGFNFGAAYDAGGRLVNVTYASGALTVTYTYDSRDRLTRVKDSLTAAQIDFAYDDAGRLKSATRANGVHGGYTYDAAGRLTRIQEGAIIDIQYALDAAGQITAANFTAPLDPANFLAPANPSFGYDAAHQITNPGYAYDARGRLVASPGHSFSWDGASRLAQIDGVTLIYNGLNDLDRRTESGVTTRLFYNYALGLAPTVAERVGGAFARYYVWTPGGRLLYLIDAANGNTVYYFHFDRVGSTLALTSGAGAVTDAYAYTPYGVLLARTGANPQPFTYVGAFGVRSEPAANLFQMRARYYDPASARFLSRDPLWPNLARVQDLNPYQYAVQSPVKYHDPSGLDEFTVFSEDLVFQEVANIMFRDSDSWARWHDTTLRDEPRRRRPVMTEVRKVIKSGELDDANTFDGGSSMPADDSGSWTFSGLKPDQTQPKVLFDFTAPVQEAIGLGPAGAPFPGGLPSILPLMPKPASFLVQAVFLGVGIGGMDTIPVGVKFTGLVGSSSFDFTSPMDGFNSAYAGANGGQSFLSPGSMDFNSMPFSIPDQLDVGAGFDFTNLYGKGSSADARGLVLRFAFRK
ncbi:MAG: hypothetical protein HY043_11930 [Verrucomicrobia bacterium]|nr:hypothetical protein [Verrucomicrobiota bacterium]